MFVACAAGPTPCRMVRPWDRETEAWRQRLLHRRRGRSVPSLGRGSGMRPTAAPVAADGSREHQGSGWFGSETHGRRRSPRCPLQAADSGSCRHPSPCPALAAPRPPVREPLGTSASAAAGLGRAPHAKYQLKGVCGSGRWWPLGKGEVVGRSEHLPPARWRWDWQGGCPKDGLVPHPCDGAAGWQGGDGRRDERLARCRRPCRGAERRWPRVLGTLQRARASLNECRGLATLTRSAPGVVYPVPLRETPEWAP